jgi:hypothetical protein
MYRIVIVILIYLRHKPIDHISLLSLQSKSSFREMLFPNMSIVVRISFPFVTAFADVHSKKHIRRDTSTYTNKQP